MSLKTINDLTAVDESQLQNDALIEGAIPPVSGSIFAPVKVTLAKLAKWILNSYTGLSLAGSSQSVKAALDGLNGKLAISSAAVTITLGSITNTLTAYKIADIVVMLVNLGDGTDFSSATGSDAIGKMPSGYRPATTYYYPAFARRNGVWASAEQNPAVISIDSSGNIMLRANSSMITTMRYLVTTVVYTCAS